MITVESNRGRLGNQLFPYAFSRLLASTLGYAMDAKPIRGFPNTGLAVPGLVSTGERLVIGDSFEEFDTIAERCLGHRVVVHGYFEKATYYVGQKSILRRLFWPSIVKSASDHTVLHVRGTDFFRDGKALPHQYYSDALRFLGNPSNVLICTDDPQCDTVVYLRSQGASIAAGNDLEDFATMMAARNLIISRSTFAWWAAFLSTRATIIQPLPSVGWHFLDIPHTRLYVPDWQSIRISSNGG